MRVNVHPGVLLHVVSVCGGLFPRLVGSSRLCIGSDSSDMARCAYITEQQTRDRQKHQSSTLLQLRWGWMCSNSLRYMCCGTVPRVSYIRLVCSSETFTEAFEMGFIAHLAVNSPVITFNSVINSEEGWNSRREKRAVPSHRSISATV